MDGGGRKRRKVSSAVPDAEAAVQSRALSTPSWPSTSRQPLLDHVTASAPILVRDQPFPEPEPTAVSAMTMHQDNALPLLPDVSEAIHARVAQRLHGAPDAFLLAVEDSPSDEETSPGKGKEGP